MKHIGINRIFSKFYREIKEEDINESDIVEWTGEALEFMSVAQLNEEAVAFLLVKDYQAEIPNGYNSLIQIAKNENYSNKCFTPETVKEDITNDTNCTSCQGNMPILLDCNGKMIIDYEVAYYRPHFDLIWEYQPFSNSSLYVENFVPVRKSENNFHNTILCEEGLQIFKSNQYEYSIINDEIIRFNFKEGQIALAYYKTMVDKETGYPLIPDNISFITAITYYIKWKIAEYHQFNRRAGWDNIPQDLERKWLKYCSQAKSWAKMPKTIDDYQDLMEQSYRKLPDMKRYNRFFGKYKR